MTENERLDEITIDVMQQIWTLARGITRYGMPHQAMPASALNAQLSAAHVLAATVDDLPKPQ